VGIMVAPLCGAHADLEARGHDSTPWRVKTRRCSCRAHAASEVGGGDSALTAPEALSPPRAANFGGQPSPLD
jgi:hypothetical protein